MKKHRFTTGAKLSGLLAFAIILTGCHSTVDKRAKDSPAPMTTLQSVENDIVALNVQVDATTTALSALFALMPNNPTKAFQNYAKSADQMQKAGGNFLKHADAMAASGADYLSEGRKPAGAYTPQVRTLNERSSAELVPVFTRISQSSVGLRSSLQTYLADIKDLKTNLSTDLTPNGVEAMRPTADKALEDGVALKLQIEPVLTAVTEAQGHLSPNAAPATGR